MLHNSIQGIKEMTFTNLTNRPLTETEMVEIYRAALEQYISVKRAASYLCVSQASFRRRIGMSKGSK